MGSKKKRESSASNIDTAQLQAMQQQQRLADEARLREQQMIEQQTAQQQEQFNNMLGVYQAQAQVLSESKAAQEAQLKELEAQQAAQLEAVRAEKNREATIARFNQRQNVQGANRQLGLLSERRAKAVGSRASVFGNTALPTGYTVNKGIMS